MNKLISFKNAAEIQDYANIHHEGNFSMAVRALIAKALKSEEVK